MKSKGCQKQQAKNKIKPPEKKKTTQDSQSKQKPRSKMIELLSNVSMITSHVSGLIQV